MRNRRWSVAFLAIGLSIILSACGGGIVNKSQSGGKAVGLNGAGSTFVYPILSKWSAVYEDEVGKASVNYQSIGSGGGIQQLIARTVDFGATDGPMNDEQLQDAGEAVLHIPVTMGAVVPTYNIEGVSKALNLDGPTLAGIFLGKIKNWNDEAIQKSNQGVTLPDEPIVVVHRSDGSGTTYIWVDYLAKVSPEWESQVGVGTSVNWPVGIGSKGNEGVAGQVGRTPGAIGYVELSYAIQNKMKYASVLNSAGSYVKATPVSVSAAAVGAAANMPEDMRVSITDPPGKKSYPISGFTWALLYEKQRDAKKGKALVDFLWWTVHEGQSYAPALDYAALPRPIVMKDETKLRSVSAAGKSILSK